MRTINRAMAATDNAARSTEPEYRVVENRAVSVVNARKPSQTDLNKSGYLLVYMAEKSRIKAAFRAPVMSPELSFPLLVL